MAVVHFAQGFVEIRDYKAASLCIKSVTMVNVFFWRATTVKLRLFDVKDMFPGRFFSDRRNPSII